MGHLLHVPRPGGAVLLLSLIGIIGAPPGPVAAQSPPQRTLIQGVPFVSWADAARSEYEQRDLLNPSLEAARRMVVEYWAPPGSPPERQARATEAWQEASQGTFEASLTVADLKQWLAEGTPVLVTTTLTPYAHPLPEFVSIGLALGQFKEIDFGLEGSRSNSMGRMVSLDALAAMPDSIRLSITRESVLISARVLVGYDDARGVFQLHDPSFGPAFELSYSDFERMWDLAGRLGVAPRPEPERPGGDSTAAYPAPTAEQRAARSYVFGYALASTGRLEDGARELEAGLGLVGLSPGYRHLLLFELALDYGEQNRMEDAVSTCRQAVDALPDDAGPWSFLAAAYPQSSVPQATSLGKEAGKRARKLRGDRKAMQSVVEALPSDFWISGLASYRGWASR